MSNIIKEQEEKKIVAKFHMRKIMEAYDIHNTRDVRHRLVDEYNIPLSDSTIKRYRKEIIAEKKLAKKTERREKKTVTKVKVQKNKQLKSAIKKSAYPLLVKDPSGVEHKIQSEITSIGFTWKYEGGSDRLCWGPVSKGLTFWYWASTGLKYDTVFTKDKGRRWGWGFMTHENDGHGSA